jgi:hypothetical protein
MGLDRKTMTYDEFQIYFHSFNNAYSALAHGLNYDGLNRQSILQTIELEADRIATMLTDKYKTVEKPVVPDLSSAVESAFKNFGKAKK